MSEQPWRPIECAPKLNEMVVEGMLPDGSVKRMRWAWGGGWAAQFGPGITGRGAWLMFNDTHQPVAWRQIDDVRAPAKPCVRKPRSVVPRAEQERINSKFGAAYAAAFGAAPKLEGGGK